MDGLRAARVLAESERTTRFRGLRVPARDCAGWRPPSRRRLPSLAYQRIKSAIIFDEGGTARIMRHEGPLPPREERCCVIHGRAGIERRAIGSARWRARNSMPMRGLASGAHKARTWRAWREWN
jgi:hypothetical protein